MNNRLQEAIRVQKIRSFHKKALQEARSLNEETLWKTFVEPFTDVLDAAKLTSQDILSAAKFSLDMIFGFSPQAIEQATQNYDKRHEELQKKWEPILDRNREALQGDADIIAFALAPHLYITSEVAMRGIDKYRDINDYMQESGMGNVFRGITYGSAGLALGGPVGAAAAVALAYGKNKSIKFKDGAMKVDLFTASAVTQVYDLVNKSNQQKMLKLINGKKAEFMKIADFALSKIK